MKYERNIDITANNAGFVKRLVWLYFWLLIFEGGLRKWAFPDQADIFLIVRDPVVLLIYFEAIRKKIFPWNGFVITAVVLGALSLIAGLFAEGSGIYVTLYGLRTDFLYIPFIFIMSEIFDIRDVKAVGRWMLILSLPMAALLSIQFLSPSDHFLNRGAAEGLLQQEAVHNIIRPAGIFSYNTGAAQFIALVFVFLVYGSVKNKVYNGFLVLFSYLAVAVSMTVSGNRGMIVSAGLVLLAAFLGVILKPQHIARSVKWVIITTGTIILLLPLFDFFDKGILVLQHRFVDSGGFQTGLIERYFDDIVLSMDLLFKTPFLGHGIGVGTNVGAAFLVGEREFLLAEGELPRIILEGGVALGLPFLLFRTFLAGYLAVKSLNALMSGNILPLLMFGFSGILIFSGQWGQPTTLGFAVFGAGLCLAACKPDREVKSL